MCSADMHATKEDHHAHYGSFELSEITLAAPPRSSYYGRRFVGTALNPDSVQILNQSLVATGSRSRGFPSSRCYNLCMPLGRDLVTRWLPLRLLLPPR
jgi:hypothetical protein